jgi:RsiW-degrading membrane proteinase PrsW (M82 family)
MVPFLLVICFLPIVAWIVFLLRGRVLRPTLVFAGFFAGLAAVLAAIVPITLSLSLTSPTFAACAGPFIEELAKLAAVAIIALYLREDSSLRSLLAVAILVGLSFASFENVAYALRNPAYLPFRLVSAVPLHAALALCAAMSLSGRFARDGKGGLFPAGWFLMAFVLHALFNLALDAGSSLLVAAGCLCLGSVWLAVALWRRSGSEPEDA